MGDFVPQIALHNNNMLGATSCEKAAQYLSKDLYAPNNYYAVINSRILQLHSMSPFGVGNIFKLPLKVALTTQDYRITAEEHWYFTCQICNSSFYKL